MIKINLNKTPLLEFKERHNISLQQLHEICGKAKNCSETSVDRVLKGVAKEEIEADVRKTLASKLPEFLLNRGLTASEIDAELSAIFTQGEYQPMVSERVVLNKFAQKYFGLSEDPFALLPRSSSEVYLSSELKALFAKVVDAIKFKGFLCITGGFGSGKTILRMLVEDKVSNDDSMRLISPETFDMSKLTASAIARKMLESFGETKIPRSPVAQTDRLKELAKLNSHINHFLMLDDMQRLDEKSNKNTLLAFKNFYEILRHGFSRDIAIVLLAQPSFLTTLGKLPELKSRVEHIKMPEFKSSAIDYLEFRLKLVGGDISIFDAKALEIIKQNSDTPLSLGNAANKALNLACFGYEEKIVRPDFLTTEEGFAQLAAVVGKK